MHPFPPEASLKWIEGDELSTITLGPFQITFKFESGASISVEHSLEVVDLVEGASAYNPQDRTGGFRFEKAFLQNVLTLTRDDDLTLSVRFERGQTLRLRSVLGAYECGMIFYPHGAWDVF